MPDRDRETAKNQEAVKQELLAALRAGRDALGEALSGVDDAQAKSRPRAGGWSIVGCVEHLAISERFLLGQLLCGSLTDRSHENLEREAKIRGRALNRERRIEAPEDAHPTGRCGSLREALSLFDSVRAETVRYLREFQGDLKCWLADHPMAATPVNHYEMLVMIALHPVRHAQQILALRADLDVIEQKSGR